MNKSDQGTTEQKLQGEGDYEASRRYREKVTEFVQHANIDELAQKAKNASPQEARDAALAEEQARAHSKGDDPADVGIMYTSKKSDPNG